VLQAVRERAEARFGRSFKFTQFSRD
jgi:hypothetical protein